MPQFSPPQVMVVCGHCPIHPLLQRALSECVVTVVEPGQELPTDFFDIEVVETHLSSEEWKPLWELKRDQEPNQRIHVCLAQPVSAIVCRNVLEEYRRRRTS